MKVIILESSTQNNCPPRKVWSREKEHDDDYEPYFEAEKLCQKWYNEGISNAEEGSTEVQLLLYSIDVEM